MKYTRMNQILTENQELMNETIRMKSYINEKRDTESRMHTEYVGEIEALRRKLNYERDS